MDITKVAKKPRAYDTKLGLSDKEKRQNIDRTDVGVITFGEAMAGGIEAHNLNSNNSLRTTTPGKRGGVETTTIPQVRRPSQSQCFV
jgi:hypothetical protein